MLQKIVKKYHEVFIMPVVSGPSNGDAIDDFQKEYTSRGQIRIWVAFVLFNIVLFLPPYLFKAGGPIKVQLNMEVAILFALWAIFGRQFGKRFLRWFTTGFVSFYLIALVYRSYSGAMSVFYQRDANFFNDYSFVLGGLSFLLDAMNLPFWIYLVGSTAIIILVGLIFWGARKTFVDSPISDLGRTTRIGLVSLGLIGILVSGLFPKLATDLQMPVSSVTTETIENIRRSLASRENLKTFATIDPASSYDYAQYTLSETPDVYFIFFESYGSVVYKRQHFMPAYVEITEAWEEKLAKNGWSTVTTISESPTWGGGSWMSYTSTLFGLLVDQQSEYDALKKKYSVTEYPNLGRYFSSQGYEYVWVLPINRQLPEKIEAMEHRFFGADQWITFEALNYEGPLFGWGPSAPDQFTFGFIQEFVSQHEQPTFLVYLTQNSHYPWTPLPPVLEDWRELENYQLHGGVLDEDQKDGLSLGEWRQNYLQAIDNTLNALGEFISLLENENSIVVIIGDHQPPAVSRHEDGYGTMVHIISQDADLLRSFHKYGFVDGLILENLEPTIRHEGLYSLFVRNFIEQYGSNPRVLPPIFPNGTN